MLTLDEHVLLEEAHAAIEKMLPLVPFAVRRTVVGVREKLYVAKSRPSHIPDTGVNEPAQDVDTATDVEWAQLTSAGIVHELKAREHMAIYSLAHATAAFVASHGNPQGMLQLFRQTLADALTTIADANDAAKQSVHDQGVQAVSDAVSDTGRQIESDNSTNNRPG